MTTPILEELDAALASSPDADDALRATVRLLAAQPGIAWAGIAFVETTGLVVGPAAGAPDEARRAVVPVSYKGEAVGELQVDGDIDPALHDAVAERISAYVLLGWDTGGEDWEP
jgi:putative methionine-R-sulfoxide reductase with GAF domain